MKTLMMLLLAVLLCNTVKGQERPIVVDNSKYFPPYQYQVNGDCSHVALIYYLKSSLWNREFDRDPKLKENQFSNSFVWDQNADEEMKLFSVYTATTFMENQGCATVADFPITSQGSSIIPNLEVREKAMAYKSKQLITKSPVYFDGCEGDDPEQCFREKFIQDLKDSLINGLGFCVNFAIFEPMEHLKFGEVYNYKPEYRGKNGLGRHVVAIIGYNDTIQTANGRGAFKAINSWGNLEVFYLDYAWFKKGGDIYSVYFLEEDFSAQEVEISLSIDLKSSLDNKNYYTGDNYYFVNGLVHDANDVISDFVNFDDIIYHKNVVQITKVNDKELAYNPRVLMSIKSANGDYKIFSHISDLCHSDSLESLEVVVYDPISADFKDEYNDVLYSFTREPKASVPKASVHLIGVDSTLVGSIRGLPDTLMVFNDYRSKQMARFAKDKSEAALNGGAYIKESSCLLARTVITFDRKNMRRNSAPVFINVIDSVVSGEGQNFSFQFKASDIDGDELSFSIVEGQGASIDVSSGLFNFQANAGEGGKILNFTVRVSDGDKFSDKSFKITVKENTKAYLLNPLTSIEVFQDSLFEYAFQAVDDEGDSVEFSIDYVGSSVAAASIDKQSGLFRFVSSEVHENGTWCGIIIRLSSGFLENYYTFYITVKPKVIIVPNSAPIITNAFDSAFVYIDSAYRFQFIAEDSDGDAVNFSLKEGSDANLSVSGLFEYVPTITGFRHFVIEVSDGEDQTEYAFDIYSDRFVSAHQLSSNLSFKAYPNPCQGQLTISLPEIGVSDNLKLEIFDLTGKLISVPINGNSYSYEKDFQYDAASLKNGVYICRLTINGQTQKSLKIVKN